MQQVHTYIPAGWYFSRRTNVQSSQEQQKEAILNFFLHTEDKGKQGKMAKVCVSFVCCASASQFLAIWLGTVRLISGAIVTIVFEKHSFQIYLLKCIFQNESFRFSRLTRFDRMHSQMHQDFLQKSFPSHLSCMVHFGIETFSLEHFQIFMIFWFLG